jgi:branched-chain amino acid transport system substrate-binding protein
MVHRPRELWHGAAIAAAAVLTTLLAGCGVVTGEVRYATVIVAVDLSLNGDGSDLGKIQRAAIELRVNEINRRGLLGDRRLELRLMDNRSDPETWAANLVELVNDQSVTAVITGQCAACALDDVELEHLATPIISLAHSDEYTDSPHSSHTFRVGLNPSHNASVLVAELRRAEHSTVALVTTTDWYGDDGQEQMLAAAGRTGIEVVIDEKVAPNEESIQAVTARILAYQPAPDPNEIGLPIDEQVPSGPDAVVLWAPPSVVGQLTLDLRNQGYEGALFLDASAADELFLPGEVGGALEGARMVFTETLVIDDVIATSPAKAARQAWFRDYLAEHGTYHAQSSFAADALQIVVEAVNRFDSTDHATVRAAIESTQIEGLSGPLRMRPENHSGLMPQALTTLVAQGGRWRPAN